MKQFELVYTLEELKKAANYIIENTNSKILLFYGEMGVGKTTLIKEIFAELGVMDSVNSPTFSLVNEYATEDNGSVFHFDFYRIEEEEEAMDMGIEEYFERETWCLIEWPKNIKNLLPLNTCAIHLETLADNRRKLIF